jgi:hypothetical protein
MKHSPLFSQIEHAEHGHTRGIDCLIERGVNSGLTSGCSWDAVPVKNSPWEVTFPLSVAIFQG